MLSLALSVFRFVGIRGAAGFAAGLMAAWLLFVAVSPIRDWAIRRGAQAEYVRISEHEAAIAKLDTERNLRLAEQQRAGELAAERERLAGIVEAARAQLAKSRIEQEDREDEIEELRRARPAGRAVPTVRELVGERLRN